jgi:hypothetical protein
MKSFWKNHQTRFKHLLDALLRHRDLIEKQATALHFQQYQLDRQRIQNEFAIAEESRRRDMHIDVMHWLCSNDNKISYESACEARRYSPKTGSWVLEDSRIKLWNDEDDPINPVRTAT